MDAARTARTGWLLGGLAALATTGCGHTQPATSDRTLQIALTEYRLTPQRVSAHAGPLTLLVHNFGRFVHNLAVTQGGRIAAVTPPIRPGASAVLTVDLPRGSYVLASTLFDDQSLGTYGSLIVSR